MPDEETDLETGQETDDEEFSLSTDDEAGDQTPAEEEPGDDDEKPSETVPRSEFETLQSSYNQLESHKKDLDKAIHGLRNEIKSLKSAPKDEGESFTDAQLLGLMEAHKDDPATLLQLIRYESKQAAKKAGKDAVDMVKVTKMKTDADAFLTKMYPDFANEGSEIRGMINQVKEYYGLDDNPLGDLFSAGVLALQHLPEIIKNAIEQGKKAAVGDEAEKKRKAAIKDNKPSPKGGKPPDASEAVTGQAAMTAKQMGFDKNPRLMKIYSNMLKNSKTRSVSVEA